MTAVALASIHELSREYRWTPLAEVGASSYRRVGPGCVLGRWAEEEKLVLTQFCSEEFQCSPKILAYELRDVIVHPLGFVFHPQSGTVIEETVQDVPPAIRARFLETAKSILFLAHDDLPTIKEPLGYMGHPWAHNYGHWLLEVLPRILIYNGLCKNLILPMAAEHRIGPTYMRSGFLMNKRFGCSIRQCSVPVLIERLICVPAINRELHPSYMSGLVRELGINMLDEVFPVLPRSSEFRGIYVSRGDAPRRHAFNEAALVELAREKGYLALQPGSVSFDEQVKYFALSGHIISPFGAALANSIFAGQQAKITILVTNGLKSNYYRHLMSVLKLTYEEIACERRRLDVHVFESDFDVSEEVLSSVML